MQRHADVLCISRNIVVFSFMLIFRVHEACEDENEYATTLFAGQFNHTRKASMEFFEKGHVLLSSSSGNFFFSMTSCKLAIAHNDTSSSHTVVWSLPFPHCQMGNQYTLSFLRNGNFIVSMAQKNFTEVSTFQHGGGQIEVWATSTEGQNVETIELDDNGNLVLYNSKKDPIWQSFNHPSSTLLSSQVLKQGMALTLYEDLFRYSLVVEPNRVVFYMIDNITQDHKPYWELLPNCSSNASIAFAAIDEEGNFQLYDIAFNPLVIYQSSDTGGPKSHYFNPKIARFGGELWRAEVTSTVIGAGGSIVKYGGNLEVYHWSSRDGAWRLHSRAMKRKCQFPSACPRYEACEGDEGQCRCMVGLEGGCIRRGLPLKLAGAAKHAGCTEEAEFVEVKNMSYFAVEVGGESVFQMATFAECKNACRRNCSCVAFVYRQDSARSCYPISEHEPLLNRRVSSLSFVAVANPLSTVYLRAHFLPASVSSSSCTPNLLCFLLGLLLALNF